MPALDSKFSTFADGGDLEIDDIVVGLRGGINTRFSFQGVLDTYLPLAGGTMEGGINMDDNLITGLPAPSNPTDATNKDYVDSIVGALSPLTTKGDLWAYSTADTRLPVGSTNGQVLQVASGAAIGLAYSTATYPTVATSTGSFLYADGTNFIASTSLWPNTVGTAGKIIRSDGTTNAYTTATYPDVATGTGTILRADGTNWTPSTSTFADTYAVSTLLYASSVNAVSGLATANRSALSTNATGVPTWIALTDGQIVVGSTAGAPAAATLTAGAGISISNASNSITISGTGSGIGWTEVTGATQAMSADSGYVANRATLVTFTLPLTAAFGTAITVIGKGAGGWQIDQNAGQNIQIGNASSTVGVGGNIASTNRFDSIELICTTADTTWTVMGGPQGNITIV